MLKPKIELTNNTYHNCKLLNLGLARMLLQLASIINHSSLSQENTLRVVTAQSISLSLSAMYTLSYLGSIVVRASFFPPL